MDKPALRTLQKAAAAAMTAEERAAASERACARLLSTPYFMTSYCIMLYAPMPAELDVALLADECRRTGRTLCTPRTDWEECELIPARVFNWATDLLPGRHGIGEPAPDMPIVPVCTIDLVVVPALAFDRNRMRLGRGGGFYDRFLARSDLRATKVGIGFDWQLLAELPTEPHDRRLDAVVVESEVV